MSQKSERGGRVFKFVSAFAFRRDGGGLKRDLLVNPLTNHDYITVDLLLMLREQLENDSGIQKVRSSIFT